MKANPQLKKFIEPYDKRIQNLTLDLRNFITDLIPESNELIWDNYNAVAMAYSKSEKLKDAFCHIAVYSEHVNFGFNRGAELANINIKLNGNGKLIRHFSVKDFKSFPKEEIKSMIWESVRISEKLNNKLTEKNYKPKSIIMSVSKKKTRPNKKPSDNNGYK
ncbi:hypothetical protein [Algibacter aquimarinus]|uniref:YdhG-like domain-containing protein n=1 Tax=Algibacter aquimarinus TaxID=1136748 RepID=A0ABP9H2W6_9FLAO